MWRSLSFVGLVLAGLAGCATSRERAPQLVRCEPVVSPAYLWHADDPRPRGRLHACETCIRDQEEILARQVELHCDLAIDQGVCTVTGACDYGELSARRRRIAAAATCGDLKALAQEDPCVRPDPAIYWRADGD